jgi:hypothetical protein
MAVLAAFFKAAYAGAWVIPLNVTCGDFVHELHADILSERLAEIDKQIKANVARGQMPGAVDLAVSTLQSREDGGCL